MQSDAEQAARPKTFTLSEEPPSSRASPDKSSGRGGCRLRLATVLATGFGVGYSPIAPGTLGAALGVGIYCALLAIGALHKTLPVASLVLFAAGVHLSTVAERQFRQKDCPRIVIDEIASFPLTMIFIAPSPTRIAIAFALNRAADILKPFPAGRIQRLKGGWGVMLDDTISALYANLILRLLVAVLKF